MKPVLFNTPMVRETLAGNKTATRRLVKPGHLKCLESPYRKEHPEMQEKQILEKLCEPPYKEGDILYVRETWGDYRELYEDGEGPYVLYRADYPDGARSVPFLENEKTDYADSWDLPKWHPSIHMPREYARIFLRVTDVRVERLQEITEVGATAEGCCEGAQPVSGGPFGVEDDPGEWTAREHFAGIWDSTVNLADLDRYGWEANPWVWVVKFERCEKQKEETEK